MQYPHLSFQLLIADSPLMVYDFEKTEGNQGEDVFTFRSKIILAFNTTIRKIQEVQLKTAQTTNGAF